MKNFAYTILCVLSLCIGFSSCHSDDKAARKFVGQLAAALEGGDADSLASYYPEAAKIVKKDALCHLRAQVLSSDNFKVKDLGEGLWRASFGDSVKINFVEGEEDGQFKVTESYGLIDYGADRIAFAHATGWIEKSMNDIKVGKRLSDKGFLEWVGQDFIDKVKENVVIKKTGTFGDERDGGTWICSDGIIVTILNHNDFPLPSDTYEIVCSDWCRALANDTSVVTALGEEIPAHGKFVQRVDILTTMESASSQEVRFDENNLLNLLYKNFAAKGTEYKDYKRSGGKRSEKAEPEEKPKKSQGRRRKK